MSSYHSEMKESIRQRRQDRDDSMEIDDYYHGSAVVDWSGNKIMWGLEDKYLGVDDIDQSKQPPIDTDDIDSSVVPQTIKISPFR